MIGIILAIMLKLRLAISRALHRTRFVFGQISSHLSRIEIEVFALLLLAIFSPWWGIERTMPWQKIWGNQVSWADRYDIVNIIDKKQDSAISVKALGEAVATITPKEVGISYDVEALFRSLYVDQTPINRIKNSLDDVKEVPLVTFEETLSSRVDALSATVEKPAVDARIDFVDGAARITSEIRGYKVDKSQLKSAIASAVAQAQSSVDMPVQDDEPQVTSADLQDKLSQLESLKTRSSLKITVGSDAFTLNAEVLMSLLDIEKINSTEQLQLSRTKVEDYVKNIIAPRVAKSGVPQKVVSVDGIVEQTTKGVDGSILDETALVEALLNAFLKEENAVTGSTIAASAGTVAEKRYSKSTTGLQLLLEDWEKDTAGDWGVYVRDNSNGSIAGSLNPDKQFVSASIYKLYVAAYIYGQLKDGGTSGSDATSLSKTVNECLRVMIVVSDNSCPSYFFDFFGYKSIQQFVQNNGYSKTDLDNSAGGDKYTTARDTMKLLNDLDDSSLISESAEQELRGYMAQQIYRSGIPKGVAGKTVEDKVGFLYGYNHDVGYVRGDKPYTIVILSNGSSYSAIAELAKRVDTVMSK
jgi:beta-lactamase class A